MFWKRRKSPEEQVRADADAILKVLGSTWLRFHDHLPVAANATLAERTFCRRLPGHVENYPSTKAAPVAALWMLVFTAIIESRTYPVAEVNDAIATLEAKYAGG